MSAGAAPLTIAHRAGNDLSRLAEAAAAGVDYAETDLWLHRGRLEVRHDRTAGPLPFFWDRWSLMPKRYSLLRAEQVLAASPAPKPLFDLKGRARGLAPALAKAIDAAGASERSAFCGHWGHLDRLAALLPSVPRYYTLGRLDDLSAFRPRLARRDIYGISIDSRFLTREIVAELREAGVTSIITWAVETAEDAARVFDYGVSGVTSDSLELLISIRKGEVAPPG